MSRVRIRVNSTTPTLSPSKTSQLINDSGFQTGEQVAAAVAQEAELRRAADANKVDKVPGKGLSTNDYTDAEKEKLSGIESGAEVNAVETVKVNGTALVPDGNRAVDVTVPTTPADIGAASAQHTHTKSDVGLSNVDNTADADKPLSTAAQTALDTKVDKIPGKGLSANDYTDAEKAKLGGIEAGAESNNVFVAIYGTTTYGEIVAAHNAGKTVLLRYGSIILSASKVESSTLYFTGVYYYENNDHATRLLVCTVNSASVWSEAARFLEWETHKVTALNASSTDIQYPSAKAVYGGLQDRLAKNDANERITPGYGGGAVYGTDYAGVEPSAGMKAFCFSAYQEIKPALWLTGNADVSIGTAEEFIAFAISSQTDNYVGRKVVLTADIDLNPGWIAGSSAPEQAWTPIGNIDTRFAGTFDGQGHTIRGVYINTTEKYQGMFSATGENAIIQNFKLKNSYFTSTGDQLGSIAGYASGLFEKIYSESIVYGKSNYVGGLIGTNAYRSIVVMNDCWFAGSVTMNAAKSYLGGLIGGVQTGAYEASGANINNCLNTGEVAHKYTGTLTTAAAGGFVGTAQAAVTITNSVNHTNPSYQKGSGNGLFVGYGSGAVTLTNCHSINIGGKHLVYGVDVDGAAYPTCTRQNKADVAGTKSITTAKIQNLFLSDSAQGHWVCSVDSLPVLADFTGYLRRFELSDGENAVSPSQAIPAGSDISIKAGYSASFAGIIIAGLTTSSTEVIVQLYRDYPSNWAPANHLNAPSSGYLWFPSYPGVGVIEKGNGAFTLGEGNKANEEGAFAAGRNNIADGRYSAAFGDNNKVGYSGVAFGNDNEVYGILSVAEGIGNRVIGAHSAAFGYYNDVSGDSACAFGHGNKATADYQHARGKFNVEDRGGLYADIVGWGAADNARKNISALTRGGDLKLKGSVYVHSNDDSSGGYDLDEKIDKAFILRTASGNPAAFDDGADGIPVKSLSVAIEPVQSGSGDPSPDNVRPISGRTGCTLSGNGTVRTVSWASEAGIIYGGTLDVTTGVLTVDRAVIDLADLPGGAGWWEQEQPNQVNCHWYTLHDVPAAVGFGTSICSHFTNTGNSAPFSADAVPGTYTDHRTLPNKYFAWGTLDQHLSDFTAFLQAQHDNGTPVTLCYKLATPVTYQATPVEITTLLGDNVLSADTGDVTVTYRADATKVIEKLTNAILSLGGNV